MSPVQIITDLLRRLPSSVRRTLYTVLALLGLALAAADFLGVTSIGSVSMSRALELYAYISPAMGLVAVANVGKPPAERGGGRVRRGRRPVRVRAGGRRGGRVRRGGALSRRCGRVSRSGAAGSRPRSRRPPPRRSRSSRGLGRSPRRRLGAGARVGRLGVGLLVTTAQARGQQADQRRGTDHPERREDHPAALHRRRLAGPVVADLLLVGGGRRVTGHRAVGPVVRHRGEDQPRGAGDDGQAEQHRHRRQPHRTGASRQRDQHQAEHDHDRHSRDECRGTPADSHVALLAPRTPRRRHRQASRATYPLRPDRDRHAARRRT